MIHHQDSPDFFHGPSRSKIIYSHDKVDSLDKLKRIIKHQSFELLVISSTPILSNQKSKANLDRFVEICKIIKSGTSNHFTRFLILDDECPTRLQCRIKVDLKTITQISISIWMLLPDQWILSRKKQNIKIRFCEWP